LRVDVKQPKLVEKTRIMGLRCSEKVLICAVVSKLYQHVTARETDGLKLCTGSNYVHYYAGVTNGVLKLK